MRELTIIIPFLNEGIEVERTLYSIRTFTGEDIDIILINDASTDGFDYRAVANLYNAKYIENISRRGVAKSRDIGVQLCSTPYFMLLDAHMRFYKSGWLYPILEILRKDKHTIYCCQTKILKYNDGVLEEFFINSFGAFMHLIELEPAWSYSETLCGDNLQDTACILGAAYITTKEYWIYLKGLEGLRCFGSDEVYISLKIWLNGGRCKLIKNLIVGHLYRSQAPYRISNYLFWYNKVFIAILLLPWEMKERALELVQYRVSPRTWQKIVNRIGKNLKQISSLSIYYN